jgi:tetratricopeptide (TPR) repeat protein
VRVQFHDQPARDRNVESTRTFAKEFWKAVKAAADEHGEPTTHFELDDDALPTRAGIGAAYRAALSPWCDCGLHKKAEIRQYFADLVGGIKKRLNPAHLYLASIAAKHPRFARTIFTTNFDPLLQRALQLVNQPYFVSDRPDSMQHPYDEDGIDAIHVVHAHGSIYRYLLLNTPEEIERHAATNKYLLNAYFERHTVLIVGYSGWDDAITRSLEMVPQFAHALYWCDRGASVEQSSLSPAARRILEKHADAFYVPIQSADQLMVDLHWNLAGSSFPDLLRSPIETLIAQLKDCDFQGVTGRRGPERKMGILEAVSGPVIARGQTAEPDPEQVDLHEEAQGIILRLESAQNFFEGNSEDTGEGSTKRARALQLMNEAADRYYGKQYTDAIRLLDQILSDPEPLTPDERALALFRRGFAHGQLGESTKELEDYTATIDLPGAPPDRVARALVNRGVAYGRRGRPGDSENEIMDYTAAMNFSGAPADQIAMALFNRGITFLHRGLPGDIDKAIQDFGSAIELPGVPADQVAKTLNSRGVAYGRRGQLGDVDRGIADFTAVIGVPGAPTDQIAMAHVNRGISHGERGHPGDVDKAIQDFSAALELTGTFTDQVAAASYNRGVAYVQRGQPGDLGKAIQDFIATIELPGVPAKDLTSALNARGLAYMQRRQPGDVDKAIQDFTTTIDLPGASTEQVAQALLNRGITFGQRGHPGDVDKAIQDFTDAMGLPGTSADQIARALGAMCEVLSGLGRIAEACQAVHRALALDGVTPEVHAALVELRNKLPCAD